MYQTESMPHLAEAEEHFQTIKKKIIRGALIEGLETPYLYMRTHIWDGAVCSLSDVEK